jgi:hypothetical protein
MAGEEPLYTLWLRSQPCALCERAVGGQVHHPVGAGMALRAADALGIPMCHQCHVSDLHGATGRCKQWTKAQRRSWEQEASSRARSRWLALPQNERRDGKADGDAAW